MGGEALLIGAAMGAASSAATGGDPLKGAVLGGITGGVGSGIANALPAFMPATEAATAAASTAPVASTTVATAPVVDTALANAPQAAGTDYWSAINPAERATNLAAIDAMPMSSFQTLSDFNAGAQGAQGITSPGLMDQASTWWKGLSPTQKLMYGGAGAMGLASLMNRPKGYTPKHYDPYFTSFRPSVPMADGGVTNESDYLSGGGVDETYAGGGITSLGGYSDGGRLLKGPGDGMSDNIPAQIGQRQPARLADGEFVIPADVVSHLGNGSTDAGAKQLYSMMDRVRQARTGNKQQGKQINPRKTLPV